MLRIPQNLHKCAIGMLNAGMTMNVVAMNTSIECSIHAIQHLRQHFLATRLTEDRPNSGCPHVMAHGEDCYIRKSHLLNRFQTATDTAANTHGTHNNRISAQTARNRLHKGG